MTAEQLYVALVAHGKPLTPARLRKAERRADHPEVWADVKARLIAEGKL
jgi:hypothetical protein